MAPRLPPPDPYEPSGLAPECGQLLPAPAAVFLKGPPSRELSRVSDAILDLRPGLLLVCVPG